MNSPVNHRTGTRNDCSCLPLLTGYDWVGSRVRLRVLRSDSNKRAPVEQKTRKPDVVPEGMEAKNPIYHSSQRLHQS